MKELLNFVAFAIEAGCETLKEDWMENFNIDNDNDLLFLYKLPFEDLKKIHNILIAEDKLVDKIKEVVVQNTNKFDESNVDDLVKFIISEIHLLGGNTIFNLVRGNQGVPYKEIVKDVCERIGIKKEEIKNNNDIKSLENLFFNDFRQQFDKIRFKYDSENKDVSDNEIKEELFDEYTDSLLKTLSPINSTGPAWRKTVPIVLIITELRNNIVVQS